MKTSDVAATLRVFVMKTGFGGNPLAFGAHSAKATLLSWAAKFSMHVEDRRLLGGHTDPNTKSALEFSRDALAGPLRSLEAMLVQVRLEKCKPDETRSGRWVTDELTCKSCGEQVGSPLRCGSCNANVHPGCSTKCPTCRLSLCRSCFPKWAHKCGIMHPVMVVGARDLPEEPCDVEVVESEEESVANDTDQEAQERAAVRLFGEDIDTVGEVPLPGTFCNHTRRTVHKARYDGVRTTCGRILRATTAVPMAAWPEQGFTLCRKPGCFPEDEGAE